MNIVGNTQPFALDFDFSAAQNEVSRQAQTYVTCLRCDREAGLLGPSFDTLSAKQETMRMVMNTLSVFGNDVPQSIIFSVCLLAFGCVSRSCNNGESSLTLDAGGRR